MTSPSSHQPSLRADEATYLRTALLLGLLEPEDAIAWADAVIRDDPAPSPQLLALALTKPELSAVRDALRPLALPAEPQHIVDAVLGLAARDLAQGRRGVEDTLQVFVQCRRFLTLEPRVIAEIAQLDIELMAIRSGSIRPLDGIHARIVALASRYLAIPPLVDIGGA